MVLRNILANHYLACYLGVIFIYQPMEKNLKIFKKIIVTSVLIALSSTTLAAQITTPKVVKRIFTEGTVSAGFYAIEGIPECKWGIMYLNLSTDAGRGMLSQVLIAKSAGFKVVRIDYSVRSNDTCLATGLHVE